jgi:SAM-dependent methyltransferase
MRPRFGAALSATVLRPLAEQLVQAIELRPGAVVCDLICDGGTLTPFLARAVAPIGVVATVDTDLELATQAAENVLHISKVVPRMSDGATVPLDDASCDAVASLLTAVFADHRFLLQDARRLLRPDGAGAVLVWDLERPPAFAAALLDALAVDGIASPFLERMLAPVAVPRGATTRGLRDVCRVETATHLWAAMLDGPLAVELAALPEAVVTAVRARYEASLREYEEPDGTLRIPVHARVITLRGGAPPRRDWREED